MSLYLWNIAHLLNNEVFTYNDNMQELNYVGTVFNYAGKFSLDQQQLVRKGLKTLNVFML